MAQVRGTVTIDRNLCKGCSLCVVNCPLGILALGQDINVKGYHPALLRDGDKCTGCGLCALMCPDVCIRVEREAGEKP